MRYISYLSALAGLLCACSSAAQQPSPAASGGQLAVVSKVRLNVPEPSDVCLVEGGRSLYIVSDNGFLYQTDLRGIVRRTCPVTGYDFEGCFQKGPYVYVAEERTRHFLRFDTADLRQSATYTVQQFGGRNKGFESITYNPARQAMVAIIERDPVELYELNPANFAVQNQVPLSDYKDVSAATYYKDKLWILSDEGMSLTRVNPSTYVKEKTWTLPILNPEGVAFASDTELIVVSDDMQTLFTFNAQGLFD